MTKNRWRDGLEHQLRAHPAARAATPELEAAVLAAELTPHWLPGRCWTRSSLPRPHRATESSG